MLRRNALAVLAGMVLLLAGCAHEPESHEPESRGPESQGSEYEDESMTFPKLEPGFGRVFFFRSVSNAGPDGDIWISGKVVGASRPGSFFYVDLRAGLYEAMAMQSYVAVFPFSVRAGENTYIRTGRNYIVDLIWFVNDFGHGPHTDPPIAFSLEKNSALARAEIRKLTYDGQVSEEIRNMPLPLRLRQPTANTKQKTRKHPHRTTAE